MENLFGERPGMRIIWIHLRCGRWEAAVHVVRAWQGDVEAEWHAARAGTTSLAQLNLTMVALSPGSRPRIV